MCHTDTKDGRSVNVKRVQNEITCHVYMGAHMKVASAILKHSFGACFYNTQGQACQLTIEIRMHQQISSVPVKNKTTHDETIMDETQRDGDRNEREETSDLRGVSTCCVGFRYEAPNFFL